MNKFGEKKKKDNNCGQRTVEVYIDVAWKADSTGYVICSQFMPATRSDRDYALHNINQYLQECITHSMLINN